MEHIRSVLGIFFILGVAYLLSNNRKKISLRVIFWGLGLQLFFALIILKTAVGKAFFFFIQGAFIKLLDFSNTGASFLFGKLIMGLPTTPTIHVTDASTGNLTDLAILMNQVGPIFAFRVLPTIIFFASLLAVLYHLGIMQKVVEIMAWVMAKTMKTSGAESMSVASNIFVGQTEAPLMVRPYVEKMTSSELNAVMIGGFATVAGGVMAAYVSFGIDAGHLMSASVMSAPAAMVMAKIIFPETEVPATGSTVRLKVEKETVNVIDAAASGASTGLTLALNVGGMLIAFLALVAMVNYFLNLVGTSLNQVLGIIFSPFAFFMGVPMDEVMKVGNLLGSKISINEFVAYLELSSMKEVLSERSYIISTYALCGFANFGSLAIQIGGIGGIAPSRKKELAKLGLKAMIGGALASWMTANIAGIFIR